MEIVHEIDLQTMIPSTNRKDRPVTDGNRKQNACGHAKQKDMRAGQDFSRTWQHGHGQIIESDRTGIKNNEATIMKSNITIMGG
ncbi:MAG: hypothetical protein FWG34_15175 [Oscillospiraceae bacterium]|nr:hypothetical protein [Oscillospiraceae bacterium]